MSFAEPDVCPRLADDIAYRPMVSIVVATYNMGQYVAIAVDSILRQSISDIDVHVVDDGSSDDTRKILGQFSHDPRFHYHFQNNAGQASAKNCGLRYCTGMFVAFCDGDDIWPSNRLEVQLPLFQRDREIGVVYGHVEHIDAAGNAIPAVDNKYLASRRHSGFVVRQLFADNFISFGSVLVRRECLEKFGGFDESLRMGIDWDLWLRVATVYKIQYCPETTLLYREWGGQMSNNWVGRYTYAFQIMEKFLRRFPDTLRPQDVRYAYAHSYVSRARLRAMRSGQYLEGLGDCLKAIRTYPLFAAPYKTVVRLIMDLVKARRRPSPLAR